MSLTSVAAITRGREQASAAVRSRSESSCFPFMTRLFPVRLSVVSGPVFDKLFGLELRLVILFIFGRQLAHYAHGGGGGL